MVLLAGTNRYRDRYRGNYSAMFRSNGHCITEQSICNLLIVDGKTLDLHFREFSPKLSGIGDRARGQGWERTGCKICFANVLGKVREEHFANAGTVSFELKTHSGKEIACSSPGLDPVCDHFIVESPQLRDAPELAGQSVEHGRRCRDENLFLVYSFDKQHQTWPGNEPPISKAPQVPFL